MFTIFKKMSNQILESLKGLSINEKLEVAQLLWEDIYTQQQSLLFPKEHDLILKERLSSPEISFKDWEEIKKKYTK